MTQKTLLSICLALSAPYCFSAPVIENITLNNASGKTVLEIHGSGFGSGPNVVLFDTFSKGEIGEQVALTSPEIGKWNNYGIYGGNPRLSAISDTNNGFLMHDFSSGTRKIAQLEAFFGDNTEIFISFDVYLPEGRTFPGASSLNTFPKASSWKFSWLIDGTGISNDNIYDMVIPSHAGGGGFLLAGNEFNFDWIGNNWFSHNTVNRISVWKKADKAAPANNNGEYYFRGMSEEKGIFEDYRNDKPIFQPGLVSNSFDRIRFPGWSGNGDQSNSNAIYDNIYIAVGDNSQARIEIGASETYKNNSMQTILPPKVWEDKYIKVEIEGNDSLINQYVFVIDSDGNSTPIGMKACSKCPEAPVLGVE